MGFSEYLQNRVLALIRPWLLHSISPIARLCLSGVELQLPQLKLDVAVLNSSLMSSSVVLLQQAQLDGATLTFSPFKTPAFALEIRGIRLIVHPRHAEDGFWAAKERRTAEQERNNAISALDPESAVIHTAAEALAKGTAPSALWTTFLVGLAFRAIRIRVQDVSVVLISNPNNGHLGSCAINLQNAEVKEGILEQTHLFGGLFWVVFLGLLDALTKQSGPSTKVCSIDGLGIKLTLGSAIESAKEDLTIEGVCLNREGSVAVLETLRLVAKFRCIQLHTIQFDSLESAFHLNPRQLDAFLFLLHQLQGTPSAVSSDLEMRQVGLKERMKPQQRCTRSSKDRWQKVVERIISVSQRKRLKEALQAAVLRHRYSHLYESWLREVGWGLDSVDASRLQSQNKQLRERLAGEISLIEQNLQVEAIALARRVACYRVSASIKEIKFATSQSCWNRRKGPLKFLFCILVAVWKITIQTFYGLVKFLSIIRLKWASSVAVLKINRGDARLKSFRHVPCPRGKQETLAEVSHHWGNEETPNIINESAQVNGNEEVAGSKRNWATSVIVHLWKGSITITGLPDIGPGQCVKDSRVAMEKRKANSSGVLAISPIRFCFEEFCLAYHSDINAMGVDLACGCIHGEALSISSSRLSKQITKILGDGERSAISEESDVVTFLVSFPAPVMAVSNNENTTVRDGDDTDNTDMATNIWKKQQIQLWAGWLDFGDKWKHLTSNAAINNDCSRLFLIASFEISQADPRAGQVSSIVKSALAMGRLKCTLDHSLLIGMVLLFSQFLDPLNIATVSKKADSLPCSVCNTELLDNCQDLSLGGWMTYYAGLLQDIVSAAVLNKRFQVSVAIESPKIELSGLVLNALDDHKTVEGRKGRVTSSVIDSTTVGFSFVLHVGDLKLVMWPAQKNRMVILGSGGKENTNHQGPHLYDPEATFWLKVPPVPQIPKDLTSDTCSECEQIGNNVFLSIKDAAVFYLSNTNDSPALPVVCPLTVKIESTFCRNEFVSLFGTVTSVSAAVVGTVSAVGIHSYVNEVVAIVENFALCWEAFNMALTRSNCTFGSASDNWSLSDNGQVEHDDKSIVKDRQVVLPLSRQHPHIFFALCFQVNCEGVKYFLSRQRYTSAEVISGEGSSSQTKGNAVLDTGKSSIYFLVQDVSLNFTWGNGCPLSFFTGLKELRLCAVDSKDLLSGNQEVTNLSQKIQNCKVVDRENDLGISIIHETGRSVLEVILCELATDKCTLYIEGPCFNSRSIPEQCELNSDDKLNFSFQSEEGQMLGLSESSAFQLSTDEAVDVKAGTSDPQMRLTGERQRSQKTSEWLTANLEIGKILMTNLALDKLIEKAMSVASGEKSLQIGVDVFRNCDCIIVELKGGLIVVHTEALIILLQTIHLYMEMSSFIIYSFISQDQKRSIQPSNDHEGTMDAILPSEFSLSKRSLSAPSVAPQTQLFGQGRYASFLWLKEGSVLKVRGISMIFAQSDSALGVPAEGILFEMDSVAKLQVSAKSYNASVDITRFLICALYGMDLRNTSLQQGCKDIACFPQFHSNSGLVLEDIIYNSPQYSDNLHNSSQSVSYNSKLDYIEDVQPLSENVDSVLSFTSVSENSFGNKVTRNGMSDCILESLKVSFMVENILTDCGSVTGEWKNSWKGACSISGFDIAITTFEIQLLLALFIPLLEFFHMDGNSNVESLPNHTEIRSQSILAHHFEIPDGAIVAVKDVREHLYLAVEKVKDHHHRLTGVLHYSLVGDRALFKVVYQDTPGRRDSKNHWFSLQSVYARNDDGDPLHVHFCHGSTFAAIGITRNKSWDLWYAIPYKDFPEQEGDEMNIFGNLTDKMVYLVNQKSKCGFTLADGSPMLVKKPGNLFKFKIVGQQDHSKSLLSSYSGVNGIPHVELRVDAISLTILDSPGGGLHLLPLLRVCLKDAQAVMQLGTHKMRIMVRHEITFEHFEAQGNCWRSIVYPVDHDFFYRSRRGVSNKVTDHHEKMQIVLFSRLKKVDVVVNELFLDTCLFLLSALDVAGPYTIKHSPVLVNCCEVKNHTGVSVACCLDNESRRKVIHIPAYQTEKFLVRHICSRRELKLAVVSPSLALYLQKSGRALSSCIDVSIMDPAIIAVRTRLRSEEGNKTLPGPIVVVDVSKQNQNGITVTVSPMVRIENGSGLPLELCCRRPKQKEGEGAVVLLENGDTIDDCMGSFDALNMEGEYRKALSSFNLGNYLLSIRPAPISLTALGVEESPDKVCCHSFEWSDDVKGAKPACVSGFFEKLHYGFMKVLKGHSTGSLFSTVHCKLKMSEKTDVIGMPTGPCEFYFLIRTTRRHVPVTRPAIQRHQQSKHSVVAWQEQQEIMFLPTIRVFNFLLSKISITVTSVKGDQNGKLEQFGRKSTIDQGGQLCMYTNLGKLLISVEHHNLKLKSKPLIIGDWQEKSMKVHKKIPIKELDVEIDFEDDVHQSRMKVFQGDDGVLQVVIYTQYSLQNYTDVPLLCSTPKAPRSFWRGISHFPPAEVKQILPPGSRVSWLERSSKFLLERIDKQSSATELDLDCFSGSAELSLATHHDTGLTECLQISVRLEMASREELDPTQIIQILPRYMVMNESQEAILVCQDGFQEDDQAAMVVISGDRASINACYPSNSRNIDLSDFGNYLKEWQHAGPNSVFSVRFRLKENGWNWSGPVCAGALGSFSVKFKSIRQSQGVVHNTQENIKFAAVHVKEHASSVTMHFCMQSHNAAPYCLQNGLHRASILFHQKGLMESEVLEPGASIGYAWDDLSFPHKLIVQVTGTQLCQEINLDKLRPWKPFRISRHNIGFGLHLPFQYPLETSTQDENSPLQDAGNINVGYEVRANGPQRVLHICQVMDSVKEQLWQSHVLFPVAKLNFKVPSLGITLCEIEKQNQEGQHDYPSDDKVVKSPIICIRICGMLVEFVISEKHTLSQLKIQTFTIDEKWQGAPFAAMLRVHDQDHFNKNQTMLHMAAVVSNHVSHPNQVKYASILLQAIDLNLDEDTLMKLVRFYRYSLADSALPSRQIYFDRFEIHPIKIIASFLPGQPWGAYTSMQESFRALLHSVIKIPSIRGSIVKLNGILLSNALLTFRQLAIKCAQHYSWYAMRAIYIAKGSKLLPPAFTSLFDDMAASSLDVFFDPSNGSIDLQGFTLGMFHLLNEGFQKGGYGGTRRYLGDLEHVVVSKMKNAGSNILFTVMTEVSDNMLKGAETGGFDGMVMGFRRGVLNVAMEPSLLRSAVVKGGSSRHIKLDRSAGADEVYIEGYLQAMLDVMFKQNYLRIKVLDDQVFLKNLPPNSLLMDEIIGCVKGFLIKEGLLAGETSAAVVHSLRHLKEEDERQLGPALINLFEQLFVVFAIRVLRNQVRSWLHLDGSESKAHGKPTEPGMHMVQSRESCSVNEREKQNRRSIKWAIGNFIISSSIAYIDGRLCRHIPNAIARQIVSGFLLSFVE